MKYRLVSMLFMATIRLYLTGRGVPKLLFHSKSEPGISDNLQNLFGTPRLRAIVKISSYLDYHRSELTSRMKAFMQIFEVLTGDMRIYLGR